MFSKVIHIVACISTLFCFIANIILLFGNTTFCLSNSSIDGHLGCFHFLVIVSNAVRTFVYEFLCGHMFLFLLYIVLMSYSGCNKLPHTKCLKTTCIYYLTGLAVLILNQFHWLKWRCWQGCYPSEGSWGAFSNFQRLPAFLGSCQPWHHSHFCFHHLVSFSLPSIVTSLTHSAFIVT